MILNLFRKSGPTEAVYAVYADIVAQSRQPHFYAQWGVPDTVTGRFDMISVHLALMLRRLRGERDKTVRDFNQALTELFFMDMDRSLREMGVGDLSVPKKIKKMGNVFYGLLTSLDAALAVGDVESVAGVVARNIFSEAASANATAFARYVLDAAAALAARPTIDLLAGTQPALQSA